MARLPPELEHAGVYASSKELGFDSQLTEMELAKILSGLSAYDCMGMIGRVGAWYYATPRAPQLRAQERLVDWLAGWDAEWRGRLRGALQHGAIVVFPQQLAHLRVSLRTMPIHVCRRSSPTSVRNVTSSPAYSGSAISSSTGMSTCAIAMIVSVGRYATRALASGANA
jgi:hypothetical protein